MEKIKNLILVLSSAISKGEWTGKYDYLWKQNKYCIYPLKENIYICNNQEEFREFNITHKDILQKLLKFVNEWYKKD